MRQSKVHYILALLVGIPLFLYIDSPYFASYMQESQDLATFLVFLAFIGLYKKSSKRVRVVMIIGLFIGFLGEYIFSILLKMYHYRLDNIPIWVAFGHSLIFVSVHKIIRIPFIRKHKQQIQKALLLFIIIYATLWLYFAHDIFGFMATLLFLLFITIQKKSRLFFSVMFLVVCYIEIIGTSTQSWYWPSTLMHNPNFISSANPPSGIAIFYFLFDYIVLFIYLQIKPKTRKRYLG